MSINKIILNYRAFLLACWPNLSSILNDLDWDSNPYFLDEWAQANWELLVEFQLGPEVYLFPYGFDQSPNSRYLNKGNEPTHHILCRNDSNPETKHRFLCFATSDDKGGYQISPPFDYVNVEHMPSRKRVVLPLDILSFEIEPIWIMLAMRLRM